jgi:hypothetical protein
MVAHWRIIRQSTPFIVEAESLEREIRHAPVDGPFGAAKQGKNPDFRFFPDNGFASGGFAPFLFGDRLKEFARFKVKITDLSSGRDPDGTGLSFHFNKLEEG